MRFAGTKEEFKKFKEKLPFIRSENIEKLATLIYDNFSKYFISKKLIITGSPIYYKLDLVNKSIWSDLDLNIINGKEGDNIIVEIQDYLENRSNIKTVLFKLGNFHTSCRTSLGSIDFYRNNWTEKDIISKLEVFPNVYTYYLTDDFMATGIIKCFYELDEIKNEYLSVYVPKMIKQSNTLNQIMNNSENLSDNIIQEILKISRISNENLS